MVSQVWRALIWREVPLKHHGIHDQFDWEGVPLPGPYTFPHPYIFPWGGSSLPISFPREESPLPIYLGGWLSLPPYIFPWGGGLLPFPGLETAPFCLLNHNNFTSNGMTICHYKLGQGQPQTPPTGIASQPTVLRKHV